jgi:hypothetical protein
MTDTERASPDITLPTPGESNPVVGFEGLLGLTQEREDKTGGEGEQEQQRQGQEQEEGKNRDIRE